MGHHLVWFLTTLLFLNSYRNEGLIRKEGKQTPPLCFRQLYFAYLLNRALTPLRLPSQCTCLRNPPPS